MNTSFWKFAALWFTVGCIVGLLVGMAIGWRLDKRVAEITGNDAYVSAGTAIPVTGISNSLTITASSSAAMITLSDQPAGYAVVLTKAVLPQAAWVSVREILPSGDMGRVLGAARRDAGTYANLVIDLLHATIPDTAYAIVLYASDASKTFSTKTLIPGLDGKTATTDFKATTPVSPSGK